MTNTYSVVGTDGVVPVHEPHGLWKTWKQSEVYEGKEGKGKFVPKVGDYVTKAIVVGKSAKEEKFLVTAVDPVTLIPTLIPFTDMRDDDYYHPEDEFLRVGRLNMADTMRVYLDTSVSPYTMTVDSRWFVTGSNAHHFVLYRNSQYADKRTGELLSLSRVYDQRNQLITVNIDLERVAAPSREYHEVKRPLPFHTNERLPDGETVIGVVYDDTGGVVEKRPFIVENTGVLRPRHAHAKYVVDITIDSPFLSESDPNLIEYPMGVTVNSFNLFATVHYSDGSSKRMAIDGSKFQILGLTDYIASIIGQNTQITLRYNLDNDEGAVGVNDKIKLNVNGTDSRFMTRTYNLRTVKPDNSYAVKLFVYPEWIEKTNNYHLRWFMFDLTRSGYVEVTEHVRVNETQSLFKPNGYGMSQRISVSVNLKDVNPLYKEYYHVQVVDIQLMRPATDRTGYLWSVGYELTDTEYFGEENWAELKIGEADYVELDISLGMTNFKSWLERIWLKTKPLYDLYAEGAPPEPNMFKIVIDGTVRNKEYSFNINQWNQKLFIEGHFKPTDNVYIVFYKQTPDTELYLGISALPVFVL